MVYAQQQLACVVIAKSTVPAANIGLFAGQSAKNGDRLAIYGGQPLHNASLWSVPKAKLQHIRSLDGGEMLAGHLHGRYDIEHYAKLGHVASFANSLINRKKQNAKFICIRGDMRTHIDINGGEIRQPDTVYLVATRDIRLGDEIFADYARNHKRKFGTVFDDSVEE